MAYFIHHPSDDALLRTVDGEHSPRRLSRLERHLADCEPCRDRRQELRFKRDEFLRTCRDDLAARTPASDRLRERVQAGVTSLSRELDGSAWNRFVPRVAAVPRAALVGAALVALVAAAGVLRHRLEAPASDDVLVAVEPGVLPVRSLTPGATRRVQLDELCGGRESAERPISPAVRQAVLRDYRMEEVPAHEYELDYLITPELGGSGDRRNLWPERYSARVWNARVKDELEQLLPQLVCRGEVDLATAQRDIAANWIAAYKKYFHTDGPVRTSAGAVSSREHILTLVSFVTRMGPIESGSW
ncbi:MAG: zf-HC2 domain-containing protein [Acidobacteriota bacterium]